MLLEFNYNDAGTVNYKYDDQGNRISKVGNGINEYYLRDQTGREVEIYKNGGTALQSINLFGNGLLGYIDKTTGNRFYYVITTVKNCTNIFINDKYCNILIDNIKHYQKNISL